ncbi:40S ribosomal protein S13 [Tanacetum coccineum]|uniref:40S ribosomal protein S13 n=1 Tax=Tanacetum coccineum TaxID=301880 RepID=A0ABQ4YUX2_9ASTR
MPIDECSSHNSPSADEGEKLDSIKRSNKTVESPSDVLGKRKRTDEGDGAAAASKIIPWQLHDWKYEQPMLSNMSPLRACVAERSFLDLEEDWKEVASEDKNGSESESVNNHYVKNLLKDKNDTESEGGLDSIEGSNKTVESPSSDGLQQSENNSWQLHLLILEALELRQDMMQNKLQCEVKNDSESELDSYRAAALDKCEDRIRSLVKSFKKLKQLPHDWEYDPDTASTFVSAEADISTLPKMPPPKEKRMYFHYEINREVKKAVKGKNYTQLMKDLEYKIDGESESDNNHDVKNLLKDKNDTELKKDLEYKNDSESERPYLFNFCSNPATASTYVFATVDNSALEKLPPPTHKSEAAASKTIPWELHLLIQDALEHRADVMLNKLQREANNGSGSDWDDYHEVQLKQCEDRIRFLAKRFKKLKQLPHDWKYDPATASTFVAAKEDTSALPETPPPKEERCLILKILFGVCANSQKMAYICSIPWGCCSSVIDPNQKFPKTTDVPLDEEEKKIWMDFKEFDKDNRGLYAVDVNTVDKHKRPLRVANPIVGLTSKFAVTAFNEAIEMYVKKGEQNNIHDFDVVKCDYLKMNETSYYFYITIEAFEERKRGVYDTKVRLNWDDGSKSLMHFVLTDRKPRVLKETTKLRTHPVTSEWLDLDYVSSQSVNQLIKDTHHMGRTVH